MDSQPDLNSSMNQSDLYLNSQLDPNSSLLLTSNHSMDSSASNLSGTSELGSVSSSLNSAGQEPMDCEVIGEVDTAAGASSQKPVTDTSTGISKSKKKKRNKEEVEQERKEREARKAKQEAEKQERRAERERQAKISRQVSRLNSRLN